MKHQKRKDSAASGKPNNSNNTRHDHGCFYCENKANHNLMICCDRCQNWYHYRCLNKKWDLNVRRSQLSSLADYYCYPCRRANPSLKLKYCSGNAASANSSATSPGHLLAEQPAASLANSHATRSNNHLSPGKTPEPLSQEARASHSHHPDKLLTSATQSHRNASNQISQPISSK